MTALIKARAWFDLIRIYNLPIPLCGLYVGAYSGGRPEGWVLLYLLLGAVLGCACTQAFNDYEDREVDLINAPFRPIPSGRISPREGLLGGYLAGIVWAVTALVISPLAAVAISLLVLAVRLYPGAKRATLLNHLLMPAALGLTPIVGALVAHATVPPAAAAVGIFLFDINMNVVGAFKDLWDGSMTERVLPAVWGARPAVLAALFCGLLGIAVLTMPVLLGWVGDGAVLPLLPALVLTLVSRLRLYRTPNAMVGYSALKAGRLAECFAFPALLAGMLPLDHALSLIFSFMLFALHAQTVIQENILPSGEPEAGTTGRGTPR